MFPFQTVFRIDIEQMCSILASKRPKMPCTTALNVSCLYSEHYLDLMPIASIQGNGALKSDFV